MDGKMSKQSEKQTNQIKRVYINILKKKNVVANDDILSCYVLNKLSTVSHSVGYMLCIVRNELRITFFVGIIQTCIYRITEPDINTTSNTTRVSLFISCSCAMTVLVFFESTH